MWLFGSKVTAVNKTRRKLAGYVVHPQSQVWRGPTTYLSFGWPSIIELLGQDCRLHGKVTQVPTSQAHTIYSSHDLGTNAQRPQKPKNFKKTYFLFASLLRPEALRHCWITFGFTPEHCVNAGSHWRSTCVRFRSDLIKSQSRFLLCLCLEITETPRNKHFADLRQELAYEWEIEVGKTIVEYVVDNEQWLMHFWHCRISSRYCPSRLLRILLWSTFAWVCVS